MRFFKDPREALILSLKRTVVALQEENVHLRHVIDMEKSIQEQQQQQQQQLLQHVPDAVTESTEELMELQPTQVQHLVDNLLQENRALRKENADLYALREALLRQQEAVTKHNEKLIRHIEGKPE